MTAQLTLNSSAAATARSNGHEGLRIGLVGPLPPPAGGMATQCKQLFELLKVEGIDVVMVQTNAPYRPVWIEPVRGARAFFRLLPYLSGLRHMCDGVDVVHVLANSGWAWHLSAAPAVWIARWKGVPVIVNYRGGDAERFLRHAPSWVRSTLRSANARIAPSGFISEVLARFDISSDIIPNVIDLSRFKPRVGERDPAYPHVIVTRNLEAIYGIDVALESFARIIERFQNARLTIAGEGPEREPLERLARKLGLEGRVRFAGRLSRDEMAELYRDADVMLNASTLDNMPNSILEAFASAVPVVSTAVGGIPFFVRDGETALLAAPGDPVALSEHVCRLLTEPVLARRLAQNGLQEASRYSWEAVREAWLGLYRGLAARKLALASRR